MTWDDRFLGLAEHVAGWSKDPSTKVGAVIVGDRHRVVSIGFNGFPRGIADTEERLNDRPTKYKLIAHAERNALDNAEVPIVGATLYVTLYPCSECAKSIVQRGIKKVIIPNMSLRADKSVRDRWIEDWKTSHEILKEGGVAIVGYPFSRRSCRL